MKKKHRREKIRKQTIQDSVFAIFRIVLFSSKAGLINVEVANAFMEYDHTKINIFVVILVKTIHCRMHGKGVIRCRVLMLYLWSISHIKTPRDIFNNFWWLDLRPLKIIIGETWKNLDEKTWVEKYIALPKSNFKWKGPWMNETS